MSRNKDKGTTWETAIVNYLRTRGAPHAERRTPNGTKDRGDITGIPAIVIEAKNTTRIDLAGSLKEAHTERDNDHADLGAVWAKRRGKTSPADGYVIMDGKEFTDLLIAAGYIP